MNIVVDDTYLISGIYTDIRTFLCRKCDYQSSNEIDDYRLVFQGRRLREEKKLRVAKIFSSFALILFQIDKSKSA